MSLILLRSGLLDDLYGIPRHINLGGKNLDNRCRNNILDIYLFPSRDGKSILLPVGAH